MTIRLQTKEWYNNSTGLNLRDSPTKVPETDASLSLNIDYSVDGAFTTRNGSTMKNKGHQLAQLNGLGMFDYRKSDGTQVNVLQNGSIIYESLINPAPTITGLNASAFPDMEFQVTADDEYLIWGNGIDNNLKFDGTTWTNLSLPQATPAPIAVDGGGGSLAAGEYSYYVSYARVVSGVIAQEGELSEISNTVNIAASHSIDLTIPVCSESLATGVTAQCNARVLYRISPTSAGVAYRIAIIANNSATMYTDDDPVDGAIEADFTNQASPKSAIFEESFGCMYFVDASRSTDLYESKPNQPWTSDATNFEIYDGPIQCVKRIYGVLFIGTDRSIWIKTGRNADSEAKRISSVVGILNNRCADGLSYLYILATNYKVFKISPTDFGFEQVRLDTPLSDKIQSLFNTITRSLSQYVALKYYTVAENSNVYISCPLVAPNNDSILVYNETQSDSANQPVWQYYNHLNAATLQMFTIDGRANMYSQDYNGFVWKLDDGSLIGDGAEVNGLTTSATATTLTDSTQSWVVDDYIGVKVMALDSSGEFQTATIVSNTATELTVVAWPNGTPGDGNFYTIGGYQNYHYTNWKSVTDSYDTLKQLWFIITNMNASGDYTIQLIVQFDFDQTISNQITLNINLQAANTIWGEFDWNDAVWGAFAVFQDRILRSGRFRCVRFGFRNYKAAQPFQCNGFSISCQDKKLFYRSAI